MNTNKPTNRWSSSDRQAFADRNVIRSKKIPNRRREASRLACRRGGW